MEAGRAMQMVQEEQSVVSGLLAPPSESLAPVPAPVSGGAVGWPGLAAIIHPSRWVPGWSSSSRGAAASLATGASSSQAPQPPRPAEAAPNVAEASAQVATVAIEGEPRVDLDVASADQGATASSNPSALREIKQETPPH